MKAEFIKDGVYWVGVQNPDLRNFNMIMRTPQGTSYNSYLIRGEKKIALIDGVKDSYSDAYLANICSVCDPEEIDYIVITHIEPDRAETIQKVLEICPKAELVASKTGLGILSQMMKESVDGMEVADGDVLRLGGKTLEFFSALRLNWPDSIVAYIEEDGLLLSGNLFGAHDSDPRNFSSQMMETRRLEEMQKAYYERILSPFSKQIWELLQKLSEKQIQWIAPYHGPVLCRQAEETISRYVQWTAELPGRKKKKIIIGYASCYGYTKEIATVIYQVCMEANCEVEAVDLASVSKEDAVKKIYEAEALALGAPTVNKDIIYPVRDILLSLSPYRMEGKKVICFGSYGWSGEAVRFLKERMENLGCIVVDALSIHLKPGKEDLFQSRNLATKLIDSLK